MTLIVEVGQGLTDAESYASVADADTYFSNRGMTNWATLSAEEKEQALRRATDYMGQAYRGRWKGYRTSVTQALDFPRQSVVMCDMATNYTIPFDVIPNEVKTACIEYAWRAASGELAGDLTQGILSESVGSLSVRYDNHSPQHVRYRAIDMLLKPFLTGSGSMVKLGRS